MFRNLCAFRAGRIQYMMFCSSNISIGVLSLSCLSWGGSKVSADAIERVVESSRTSPVSEKLVLEKIAGY